MDHLIFGHSFAELEALVLLLGLAFYFLNRKKASAHGNPEDADTGGSGSLTVPTGTNSDGSSPSPTETNDISSRSSTATTTGNSYDIFLSFRGPDTRNGFADHLYHRLRFAKIHPFRDDEELRQGEKIGPDLLAAIKNSKILIPILSENYGTSRWCLDELVQMMECKKNDPETLVLPIFYKVAPADVRHQIGKFGKAFDDWKKKARLPERNFDPTILKKWEDALKEVCELRGREVNGPEAAWIDSVVEQVLLELRKKELVIPENLIGIGSHVEKVMEVVNNNYGATLFVVIHGMGGIGKTTLAKKIYNELSSRFKYCCFIPDVRESCKRNGIEDLQNKLIYVTLKQDHEVSTRDEGIVCLSSQIKDKKVLILLDDVDKDDDLKALAGNRSWFSSGSIIIITTRDIGIIDKARGDYLYELERMDTKNSTILFSRHAFRRHSPPSEFKELTDEVVSTTGGLPLALEILGSFLCGAEQKTWTGTIKKLQKIPNEDVRKKLEISYDALSHEQKQIFLDIACFFIGTDERIASYMWDACDFFAVEIEVLRLRSLIKVGNNHELMMHDQLRDLGRWIVRKGNENTPQYCSRLWDSKEAWEMLKEKKGTSKIEALCLDNWGRIKAEKGNWADDPWSSPPWADDPDDPWADDKWPGEISWAEDNWAELSKEVTDYTAERLGELTNLRFLHVRGANFIGDFQNLLTQLRWLHWDFYSLDFEATNFHPKKLVVLDLSQTKISEHWGGWDQLKMATELKVLNLSHCRSLTTTPDLSAFKRLEILILEGCGKLKEIHPSLGIIKSLVSLNVKYCYQLKELPGWISSQNKLETLDASYCQQLACIPSSIDHLPSLSLLNLSHCNELAQLPDSIGSLTSLQRLLLSGCLSLRDIPESIGKLASLTELDLKLSAIVELPYNIWNKQNLSILDISQTPFETRLCESDAIRILANIQKLRASGCKNLEGLPGELVLLNMVSYMVSSMVSSLQKVRTRYPRELPSCLLARVLSQRLRTPPTNNLAMDHQTADSEHVLKRSKPFGISDEVNNLSLSNLHVTFNSQSHSQSSNSSDNLPKNVVMTLNQGSPVKSMDFHPVQQILLLVGTDMGDVIVWEVGSCARIAVTNFEVWDQGTCSKALQASLANENKASVNRVRWSPDGILFGVAYSKHMVHIYLYLGGGDIRNHLEIEAHVGSVNDLAFSCRNKQLFVVTCGEDKLIKVWDAVTGAKQHVWRVMKHLCIPYVHMPTEIFSTSTQHQWMEKLRLGFMTTSGPQLTRIRRVTLLP